MSRPVRNRQSRLLWIVLTLLLVAAIALWVSSRLPWSAEYRDVGVRGLVLDKQTGVEHSNWLVPLASLALAGTAGIVATSGWLRRIVGGLLVVAGSIAGPLPILGSSDEPFANAVKWEIITGRGLGVLAGILLVVGGLLAIKGAVTMPRLGARYEAPQRGAGARRTTSGTTNDTHSDTWKALSEGKDPTIPKR